MARIFLIEADHLLAGSVQQFLEAKGHNVIWQSELQDAVNSVDKSQPQLVVMELTLASRSGMEFLYEFRSYSEWQKIPVIIYSYYSPEELNGMAASFDDLGIEAYLYKPTNGLKDLSNTIDEILEKRISGAGKFKSTAK